MRGIQLSLAVLSVAQTVVSQGWPYQGCYTDSTTSRTLRQEHYVDAEAMTPDTCKAFCAHKDLPYAGVEFGRECYCDYLVNPTGTLVSDSDCNQPCAGDPEEDCGAADRISIYYNGNPSPTIQDPAGTFKYKGCYKDKVSDRTLPHQINFPFGLDPDDCTAACKEAGYRLAGLEYGRECWCGNTLDSVAPEPDSDCYMRCLGSHLHICGGPDRLTLYQDRT